MASWVSWLFGVLVGCAVWYEATSRGGGVPCPTNCVSCKLCKKGSRYKEGGGASIGDLSFWVSLFGGSFTSSI